MVPSPRGLCCGAFSSGATAGLRLDHAASPCVSSLQHRVSESVGCLPLAIWGKIFGSQRWGARGDMPRELGPIELRICRIVFAFLAAMVFAFLLLSAIESLFNLSPPVREVQIQPDIKNSADHDSKQSDLSSPPIRILSAPSQKEPADSVRDDPARVALSNMKVSAEPPEATALGRALWFDPRPLERSLARTSVVPADAVPIPNSTEMSQPQQEGTLVTTNLASAEPSSLDVPQERKALSQPPAPTMNGEPKEPIQRSATLEDVGQIQSRLRDLGFLSSANSGAWDRSSRNALREFKLVNHLGNNDTWDLQTSEKLNSETTIRADQSFIGIWSTAPCRSARTKEERITINSRRTKSSAGSVCEFHDFASDNRGWRVRATCSQGDQHWTANGKFALKDNKLVWTSGSDVIRYFRCN
jgi:hypothetical protein